MKESCSFNRAWMNEIEDDERSVLVLLLRECIHHIAHFDQVASLRERKKRGRHQLCQSKHICTLSQKIRTLTDAGVQSTTSELLFNKLIKSGILLTSGQLLLYVTRLLGSSNLIGSTNTSSSSLCCNWLAIVLFVCYSEWCSINLNNGTLDQCICSDQFVVGCVEDDSQYTGLGGNVLRSPCKVSAVKRSKGVRPCFGYLYTDGPSICSSFRP